MIRLYGEAKWWLHPGFGIELFCLAAAKAQTAGCIPIIRPSMALDEVVRCGYKVCTNLEGSFIDAVIAAMNGWPDSNTTDLGMPASAASHIPSWKETTRQLAEILTDRYRTAGRHEPGSPSVTSERQHQAAK